MVDTIKKVVKIILPAFLFYNKKFDALMYSFQLVKKYKNDITFKDFKKNNGNYITYFDNDDKNLKIDKFKNGVWVFYYDKLPEIIPPLIE